MSRIYLKKLGKNIKNLRETKGLSQEQLAEKIGKSRNHIGMVERAEVNISVNTLFRLAKVLEVEPKIFFEF